MKIAWPVLAAACAVIGGCLFFLFKAILKKNRELALLRAAHQQVNGELLQARSEHAREMAELKADHAKRLTALQRNVNDLAGLLKEHGSSGWEKWPQTQRK